LQPMVAAQLLLDGVKIEPCTIIIMLVVLYYVNGVKMLKNGRVDVVQENKCRKNTPLPGFEPESPDPLCVVSHREELIQCIALHAH
jgi:hypothetical protein